MFSRLFQSKAPAESQETPASPSKATDTVKALDATSDSAVADPEVVGAADASGMSAEALAASTSSPAATESDTAKQVEAASNGVTADSKVAVVPTATAFFAKEVTARDDEGKLRTFSPSGSEMVQVTVFGIKNFEGITSATVKVEVEGKYNFQMETKSLTGHALHPKSTITYVKPGDDLKFTVVLGEESCQASVKFEDFYPSGFEGDLVVGTNNEIVAIKLSVSQNGEIQPLAPVVVKSVCTTLETLPVQGAPLTVGPSKPRIITPEEFQKLCSQPGAAAPVTLTHEEFAKLGC